METKRSTVAKAEELLGKYHEVLDRGFVCLVDYMGSDDAVDQAARVSYGSVARDEESKASLIKYLMKNRHTSPFEMVELKFHCKMPLFIARQWIRHRTASVNEQSARYKKLDDEYYFPEYEQFRSQSRVNKQGRSTEVFTRERYLAYEGAVADAYEMSRLLYEDMLGDDVAREIARGVLPTSVYTQWYWKIDLHNLFHFLKLRLDEHAQWEIREYAKVMADITRSVVPICFSAWEEHELCGMRLSKPEVLAVKKCLHGSVIDLYETACKIMPAKEAAELVEKIDMALEDDH